MTIAELADQINCPALIADSIDNADIKRYEKMAAFRVKDSEGLSFE